MRVMWSRFQKKVSVTVRFCGSHWNAPTQYQKLAEFITEHKLQIIVFSKKITIIDYGITSDTEQFYNYTLFDRRGFYSVLYLRFYRYLSIFYNPLALFGRSYPFNYSFILKLIHNITNTSI